MVRAETLLPEPDSPTMPSERPALDVVGDAVDGAHDAVVGDEAGRRGRGPQQRRHQYRTRGSRKAYTMSTIRFMMMMKNAPKSTVPWMIGQVAAPGSHRRRAARSPGC